VYVSYTDTLIYSEKRKHNFYAQFDVTVRTINLLFTFMVPVPLAIIYPREVTKRFDNFVFFLA